MSDNPIGENLAAYNDGYEAGQQDGTDAGYDEGYEAGADEGRQEVYDELLNLGNAEEAWHVIRANGRAGAHSNVQLVNREWAAAKRGGLIK